MSMTNLARIAKVVALLLFFMPWVTISCSPRAMSQGAGPEAASMANAPDMPLARVTGIQLATGKITTMRDGPAATATPAAPGAAPEMLGSPNYAVVGGALLILLALVAGFVLKGSTAALAGAAGSALAAVSLCYAVFVQVPVAARESFSRSLSGTGGPPMPAADAARAIHVNVEMGFYLVLLALVAAVVLNVMGMRGSSAAAAPAEPPAV